MSYCLDKMIGRLREDAPVLPLHIKESVMAAVRADPFSGRRVFVWRYAVGLGTFLILGTGGTVFAAQQVAPGNMLYSLKRASETAYVSIQTNPQARAGAQQLLIDRRFDEAEKVADRDDNINDADDRIENELTDEAMAASDAWVNAQEEAYSNDIQLAASR